MLIFKILVSVAIGIAGLFIAWMLALFGPGADPNTGKTSNKSFLITLGITAAIILCIFLSGCTTDGMGFPRFKRANEWGRADTQNLKNMSAREIQTAINAPLYEEGTVERAWDDAFWDETLSYRTRNKIGVVADEYSEGQITSKEALRRIKLIRYGNEEIK